MGYSPRGHQESYTTEHLSTAHRTVKNAVSALFLPHQRAARGAPHPGTGSSILPSASSERESGAGAREVTGLGSGWRWLGGRRREQGA